MIEWGLTVTQIHGGMKIGDRDSPGTRIYAEREFKESCQLLVATEAVGEGINLQFCWLMINFDIPWNPVRLEQRVGRIHRYGQEKDCQIFNFVAQNTREGRVLQKLLERLAEIREDLGSDQVFDVVGEVFPANQLERMLREMYARQTDVRKIEDRIVRDVSPEKFRAITESTLEGLAKKEINLSEMIGKSVEAKERRLVPEVIEQFFIDAAPESGVRPKPTAKDSHIYRIGKTPRNLLPIGDAQEGQVAAERLGEVDRIRRHVEVSLNSLINHAQLQQAEFVSRQIEGRTVQGLDGLIAQAEQHLDELNNRLESRIRELELESHSSISEITHVGRAWIAPHPERANPQIAPMVRNDEIERIAVEVATRHEESRGWVVESVESENRGFDLISRGPHPEDPKTFIEVRFIEVKGRAGIGIIALSENEYRTAERLKKDYWLYTVFNCASTPELHIVQNPARLSWQPVMAVEHYRLGAESIVENTSR